MSMAFFSFGTGVLDQARENLQAQRDAKTEAEKLAAEQENKKELIKLQGKNAINVAKYNAGKVNSSNYKTFGNPEDANHLRVDTREGQAAYSLLSLTGNPGKVKHYLNDSSTRQRMIAVIAQTATKLQLASETDHRDGIDPLLFLQRNNVRPDNPVLQVLMGMRANEQKQDANNNPLPNKVNKLVNDLASTSNIDEQGKATPAAKKLAKRAVTKHNLDPDSSEAIVGKNKTFVKALTNRYALDTKSLEHAKRVIFSPAGLGVEKKYTISTTGEEVIHRYLDPQKIKRQVDIVADTNLLYHKRTPGYLGKFIKPRERLIDKGDKIFRDKRREKMADSGLSAKAGLITIDKLITRAAQFGTGSSIVSGISSLLGDAHTTVNEIGKMIVNARSRVGQNRGIERGVYNTLVSVQKRYTDANKAYQKDTGNAEKKRAVIAAEMSVLETMLAYQVTSALQGGTGGRTISDQDVKYALKLFTGIFDSSKQRLSKLAMIRSMLNRVAVKSDMWNLIRPGKNVSYIRAVDRMLEVLDYGGEYNLDNFTNKIEDNFTKRMNPSLSMYNLRQVTFKTLMSILQSTENTKYGDASKYVDNLQAWYKNRLNANPKMNALPRGNITVITNDDHVLDDHDFENKYRFVDAQKFSLITNAFVDYYKTGDKKRFNRIIKEQGPLIAYDLFSKSEVELIPTLKKIGDKEHIHYFSSGKSEVDSTPETKGIKSGASPFFTSAFNFLMDKTHAPLEKVNRNLTLYEAVLRARGYDFDDKKTTDDIVKRITDIWNPKDKTNEIKIRQRLARNFKAYLTETKGDSSGFRHIPFKTRVGQQLVELNPDQMDVMNSIIEYFQTDDLDTGRSKVLSEGQMNWISATLATAFRESSFRTDAIGDSGNSLGLFQIFMDKHKYLKEDIGYGSDKVSSNTTPSAAQTLTSNGQNNVKSLFTQKKKVVKRPDSIARRGKPLPAISEAERKQIEQDYIREKEKENSVSRELPIIY